MGDIYPLKFSLEGNIEKDAVSCHEPEHLTSSSGMNQIESNLFVHD